MRSERSRASVGRVTGSLRVYVDFDTRTDPIAGRLSSQDGEWPFTGWLGLISALESVIGPRDQEEAREGSLGAGAPRASAGPGVM
jgi:hypothetical protein